MEPRIYDGVTKDPKLKGIAAKYTMEAPEEKPDEPVGLDDLLKQAVAIFCFTMLIGVVGCCGIAGDYASHRNSEVAILYSILVMAIMAAGVYLSTTSLDKRRDYCRRLRGFNTRKATYSITRQCNGNGFFQDAHAYLTHAGYAAIDMLEICQLGHRGLNIRFNFFGHTEDLVYWDSEIKIKLPQGDFVGVFVFPELSFDIGWIDNEPFVRPDGIGFGDQVEYYCRSQEEYEALRGFNKG